MRTVCHVGLLEVDQVDAVDHLLADAVAEGLDGAAPGRADGVFHLHRLQHQQRRALVDAGADRGDERDHLARHRRLQPAADVVARAAGMQRVHQHQRPGAAFEEDMAPFAGHHHRGIDAAFAQLRMQLAVGAGAAAHQQRRPVQRHLVAAGHHLHRHRARHLTLAQRELARGMAVEAPAVEHAPGRFALGRARGRRRLALQFGQRGQQPHLVGCGRLRGEQVGLLALDQRGVQVGVRERRHAHQPRQELDVVGHAEHAVLRQRLAHARQRGLARAVPDDQLGDHRVVVRRDRVALLDAGVHAHMLAFRRRRQVQQLAGGRQEALVRVFGIDARLDRVAVDGQLLLAQRQRLAGGHAQLPFHQVQPGDHLGHRVLDLQPRVHLHEVEAAVLVGDELHRAGADIAHRLGGIDGRLAHRGAAFARHARRGRFFQHLLVAALHRAVALEQVDAVAMAVAEDLDLDVPRPQHVLLDQHMLVAEGVLGFALARGQRGLEVLRLVDAAHALAAAAGTGLDQHRIADGRRLVGQEGRLLVVAVVAGRQRHAGLGHQRLGGRLAAHRADGRCRRADEDDAGRGAGLGELVVLRQEAVARVHGLRAGGLGGVEDLVRQQVGLARRRRADQHRLVGQAHMARIGIGLGIHRHRGDAHAPRGLDHAAGDLASIGDQDLAKHASPSGRLRALAQHRLGAPVHVHRS